LFAFPLLSKHRLRPTIHAVAHVSAQPHGAGRADVTGNEVSTGATHGGFMGHHKRNVSLPSRQAASFQPHLSMTELASDINTATPPPKISRLPPP